MILILHYIGPRFWSLLRQLCLCLSKSCQSANSSTCKSYKMGSLQV